MAASVSTPTRPEVAPRAVRQPRAVIEVPLWWAIPGLLFVFAFIYLAFGAGAWYAFTDWDGISAGAKWIGLANFKEIAQTPEARQALWHTLELTFAFVIVSNAIGLALALALHRTVRSRNILRALFF